MKKILTALLLTSSLFFSLMAYSDHPRSGNNCYILEFWTDGEIGACRCFQGIEYIIEVKRLSCAVDRHWVDFNYKIGNCPRKLPKTCS